MVNNNSKRLATGYFAVLVAVAALYIATCAPGLLWQDSGMIQYRVWHNDIEGGLGLALSHPLFYILAIGTKYVPFGEFAYRVNLVSAIAAAVAVANVFLLLRLWLGRNIPALIAAVTLAVSHTFWRHACIAETYTYLYWLGLFNGLAIADHMFASIPFMCYLVFLAVLLGKKQIKLKHIGLIVVLWVVGALPYEYLIVKNIIQSGNVAGTLASAAFGSNWQGAVLNTCLSLKIVKENVLFLLLNFPTLNVLLFFAGCFGLFKFSPRRAFTNILLALLILFFIFAFRYTVVDRYAFFIPFYFVVSIFTGVGIHFLQSKIRGKVFVYVVLIFSMLPVAAYAVAPKLAENMGLGLGTKRKIAYRNDYTYFLQPWKTGYRGAQHFALQALDSVEKGAVIYADGTTVYPLILTQQVEGRRRDVTIVSRHGTVNNLQDYNEDVIDKLFAERAVYVVSAVAGYCPQFLLERYSFVPAGVIYRAVK